MVPVIEQSIKDLETKYTMHIEYVVIDARKNLNTRYPSQLKSGEERVIVDLLE